MNPRIKIGRRVITNPAYIKTLDDFKRDDCFEKSAEELYCEYMKYNICVYEGDITEFLFTKQEFHTFERLQSILCQFDKCLTYIHASIMTPNDKCAHNVRSCVRFVAHNYDKSFYWHRTECSTIGEEINHVYINNKRYKLVNFFDDQNIQRTLLQH